nr:MAG TPA: hypothetical protein [Caudoviricetes sp.]DAQ91695.1 MAG TPA: hypothetical protein [Caudoviricetes sp.]
MDIIAFFIYLDYSSRTRDFIKKYIKIYIIS